MVSTPGVSGIGYFRHRKYTEKVGQDNVNIVVVTIFRLPTPAFFRFIEWINACYEIFIFTGNDIKKLRDV